MIRAENISVDYGRGDVVRNVSFSVAQGERLCIAGPNGCGKSTLVAALTRILPYRGKVSLNGTDIAKMPRKTLARHMALLGQLPSVYFSYTVEQTVAMGRYPHSKSRLSPQSAEDRAIVAKSMAQMGLEDIANRPITEISGGQLQRTLLARLLAQSPKLVLLDEPMNHLDLVYQAQLLTCLEQWQKEENGAIIAVFHDLNLVRRFADRVLLLEEGQTAAYGETDAVFASGAVNRVYGMDVAKWMRSSLEHWSKDG